VVLAGAVLTIINLIGVNVGLKFVANLAKMLEIEGVLTNITFKVLILKEIKNAISKRFQSIT
jgi:hypothetical protein